MNPSPEKFAAQHPWDRNYFLCMTGLAWLGIIMGFGSDLTRHLSSHEAPYPLIVHVHAVVFLAWLVLFTVQVLLIRERKFTAHRKLGMAMGWVAALMILLGPATALTVKHLQMNQPGADPAFLGVQLTDMLAFAGLVGAGIWWRKDAASHKRLVLLGTLYITDAGFARWLAGALIHLLGDGSGATWIAFYFGPNVLMLGAGLYDLATRRRLHPAYLAGIAWVLTNQFTGVYLLTSTPWTEFAKKVIAFWP
ncbi:MAG TPA: hypothetical protein VGM64_09875 [Lacunisphaera sp.]|jgi:hypothetical protein